MYTWIDHIITTEYDLDKIVSCNIVPLEEGNVSHRSPVRFSYILDIPTNQTSLKQGSIIIFKNIVAQTGQITIIRIVTMNCYKKIRHIGMSRFN